MQELLRELHVAGGYMEKAAIRSLDNLNRGYILQKNMLHLTRQLNVGSR